MKAKRRALWLVVLLCVSGCSLFRTIAFDAPASSVELEQVPFFAQSEYQCGPAALATMLSADGVSVSPDELRPLVYLPARKGSFQAEMMAAARKYDRLPVRLLPQAEELISALQAGYPVLVLQNLGLATLPAWHYAVVVGYASAEDAFILRSGTDRRLLTGTQKFLKSWDLAGRWAIVLGHADHVTPMATPESWVEAAAPFESTGGIEIAESAYRAAALHWPELALPWLALANVEYAKKNLTGAERHLRQALKRSPDDAVAHNNLAQVLLEQGCPQQAQLEIEAISEVPSDLGSAIAETKTAIQIAFAQGKTDCKSK